MDEKTAAVAKLAEDRRREIASQGDQKIPIYYSPKPGSSGNDSSIDARPQTGKVLEFTMRDIAKTGKNKTWGTALYLIAREFESSVGIELGACAGISGIYLSSAPNLKKFITVEGSEALAKIAQESLKSLKNVKVVNSLFDEAIDSELPSLDSKIDLAYIDGHHEKIATIHYFNRLLPFLNPNSVVIFDDISWSYDMRDAWNILSKRSEFAYAMDLGVIGICVMKTKFDSTEVEPIYWDLQSIIGRSGIGKPHGWE
ncbi:MAG: class I SAM-dependent methyltransferase [Okeania sp. SIO3B3]|nr:class I SAM-dependent methyltransferase [Okeania sp. SIO3B3]